jgi:hypothetical protein
LDSKYSSSASSSFQDFFCNPAIVPDGNCTEESRKIRCNLFFLQLLPARFAFGRRGMAIRSFYSHKTSLFSSKHSEAVKQKKSYLYKLLPLSVLKPLRRKFDVRFLSG